MSSITEIERCLSIKDHGGVCIFCSDRPKCYEIKEFQQKKKTFCFMVEFSVSKYLEGTNRLNYDFIKHLISKGHKVVLISPEWQKATLEQKKTWTNLGLELHLFRLPKMNNPAIRMFGYISNCLFLKQEFDVIYGTYTVAPAIAAILCGIIKRKRKYVGIPEPASLKKIKKSKILWFLFKRADKIWVHSETAKNIIVGDFSWESAKKS